MAEIKAIDTKSVHQICSGQVILDLSIAVKELVENSLDAGASCIEVKLKENGLDCIEVSDNGSGVEVANFAALTLKHHTSKLKDFSDLETVDTFGFRGEALSSLCALCDVTIHTKHVASSVGHKLEYDHDGRILSRSQIARQCGTTVLLKNLFKTLPVRYKELKKNIKKEYSKLLSLLSAYCIISTDVKITCSNQSGKSRSGTILSTQAGQSIQEHIAAVFGAKQLQTLVEFQQLEPSTEVCEEYNLKQEDALQTSQMYSLSGFVSEPLHGGGRSVPDRQFYFINSRPVELPRVARVINEVYHFHNRHQYPFVLINIVTHRDKVDVNVTPDKRQVFVHNEKVLFAIIKTSLIEIYKKYSGTVVTHVNKPIVNEIRKTSFDQNPTADVTTGKENSTPTVKESPPAFRTPQKEVGNASKPAAFSLQGLAKFRSPLSQTSVSTAPMKRHSSSQLFGSREAVAKQPKIDAFVSRATRNGDIVQSDEEYAQESTPHKKTSFVDTTLSVLQETSDSCRTQNVAFNKLEANVSDDLKSPSDDNIVPQVVGLQDTSFSRSVDYLSSNEAKISENDKTFCDVDLSKNIFTHPPPDETDSNIETTSLLSSHSPADNLNQDNLPPSSSPLKCESRGIQFDSPRKQARDSQLINFSMERLKKWSDSSNESSSSSYESISSFRAQIDPRQNVSAEKELTRHLSKESFLKMKPIGQFNLGFIITKLGSDLFIIDQHASDEIYNFETLQQSTEIHSLKLVVPQLLQLDPAAHSVLVDNMKVFRKNGFDFEIKINEETNKETIHMTRVPVSKNWDFGSRDVDELIFMLSDAPHVMCRPSRIRQMFASRACRKSIMIGTALTGREMLRLVKHMSEINHPWNCPHGRPTMRHLIDLSKIS